MTKDELCNTISAKTGVDKATVKQVIQSAFLDVIPENLTKGNNIYIRGFAGFKLITAKAKKVQDIGKGITIDFPARKIVKLVVCDDLKKKIAKNIRA